MAIRKKTALRYQQPYDSTLKALFEANTADMLSFVVGATVERITELTGETLKPPLRVDRGYEVWRNGKLHVVHVEMETDGDDDMDARMLEYFGILYHRYKKPIISVVMYPFQTTTPEPPLEVSSDDEEVMRFKYRVRKLWEEDARQFIQEWPASLYALVPTMKNADYEVLSQALDAIAVFYARQHRLLRIRLLWFDLFLTRTKTVTAEDRRRIMQKLDQFDSLLAQSRYVQKKMAEGEEKGKEKGKEEGRIKTLQDLACELIEESFPALAQLARQQIEGMTNPASLNMLVKSLAKAQDEPTVRTLLDMYASYADGEGENER